MTIYSVPAWTGGAVDTLLVVGSAPCLYEDVANALKLRPDAHLLLVNEACGAIEDAHHMLAGHCDKAKIFLDYRQKKFPNAPKLPIHATQRMDMPELPEVDYWWHNAKIGGTSAWKGALIGFGMGYKEIIMCGCPLDLSGYFNPVDTKKIRHECKRVGEPDADGNVSRLTERYRKEFERNAAVYGDRVRSMSGWSKGILGAP